MQKLKKHNGKDADVKLNKIQDYIQALSEFGPLKTPISEINKAKREIKHLLERSNNE